MLQNSSSLHSSLLQRICSRKCSKPAPASNQSSRILLIWPESSRYQRLASKSPVTLERWFGGQVLLSREPAVQNLWEITGMCQLPIRFIKYGRSHTMFEICVFLCKPTKKDFFGGWSGLVAFSFTPPSRKPWLEAGAGLKHLPLKNTLRRDGLKAVASLKRFLFKSFEKNLITEWSQCEASS